mgnify:CR=1 FL=1
MVPVSRHLNVIREEKTPYMIRVAFATNDGATVNEHFGSARSFSIYGVTTGQCDLLSVAEFSLDSSEDDRLQDRMAFISGCAAVYSYACGASAIRRLIAKGIQPIRVSEEAQISELLTALQREIESGPGSWLAKAIARQHLLLKPRGGYTEADSWEE